MATKYIKNATKALTPGYNQQMGALSGQIPAIQQLYQVLMGGLVGEQAVGNQNILEGAGARGILNSTMPVYDQQVLGQQIIGKQGQLGMQQQQDLADIYGKIGGLNVSKANDIFSMANQERTSDLAQTQFNYTKQQNKQNYKLQLKAAQRGF